MTAFPRVAIDAVIFDLDGTLIDTLGDFELALNRMLRELGYGTVTRAQVEPRVGKGSEHLVAEILKLQAHTAVKTHTLGPGYIHLAANTTYQKHYRAINGQAANVYPGAQQLLTQLCSSGIALACVTNKPTDAAIALLQAKGMREHFAHVFGGDAFARKKPDAMPITKACEALGTTPERTLVVGDSSNDAQAAQAAGCPLVLMTHGYNHGEPIEAVRALAHCTSFEALAQWLGLNDAGAKKGAKKGA